jgi:hypothetical protein
MSEIVNLRQARKRAARKTAEAEAAANRAKHGMSKDERTKMTADRDRARRDLDGAKKE